MTTIRDVARRAGVAPSTVSYALSGKRPISEEARTRIAEAIRELNFTPSVLGRQLAHSRSHRIGVVYPLSDAEVNWEPLEFIPGAAAYLNELGYGATLFVKPLSPSQILHLCRENSVDGLILMQVTHHDPRIETLREHDFPFVAVGRCADTRNIAMVDYDSEGACFSVFEHLVKLGHTRIGFLNLPRHKRQEQLGYANLIQRGFQRARASFGIDPLVEDCDGSIEDGQRATAALFARDPHLTAVATVHGYSAIGVQRELRRIGRGVPSHVSLAGVTRAQWFRAMTPAMTAAEIPLGEMVRKAIDMLVCRLDGDGGTCPAEHIFPAFVVPRESSQRNGDELRFLFDPPSGQTPR
jgi:DNA-binding LacI/PurR family transcriptional regulator